MPITADEQFMTTDTEYILASGYTVPVNEVLDINSADITESLTLDSTVTTTIAMELTA